MCQLLGMSCKEPASIRFSFDGFRARGGLTDEHRDGWGIAFFRDNRFDVILDKAPAAESALAEKISNDDIKSKTILAHIRKATVGAVQLNNCHPFQRELWGKSWLFCHNGHLGEFNPPLTRIFQAEGDTDSERAFCFILQQLEQQFGDQQPSDVALFNALNALSEHIAQQGTFNIMLSNGDWLYTYCTTYLAYVERKYPFSEVTLVDKAITLDLNALNSQLDQMIIVATKPLTINEPWITYRPKEARLFVGGNLELEKKAA
jgi:predicted glutamine amidotransferase